MINIIKRDVEKASVHCYYCWTIVQLYKYINQEQLKIIVHLISYTDFEIIYNVLITYF